MALGHEPNGACVWNSYRGFDSFEEYCTIVKHRRVDKVRKGEDHYHYRCANCKVPTDDVEEYSICPNSMCELEGIVLKSMKEVMQTGSEQGREGNHP